MKFIPIFFALNILVLLSFSKDLVISNQSIQRQRFEEIELPFTIYQNVSFKYISLFLVSQNSSYSNVSLKNWVATNSSFTVDAFNLSESLIHLTNSMIHNSRFEHFIFTYSSIINIYEENVIRVDGIFQKSNFLSAVISNNSYTNIACIELNMINVSFKDSKFINVSFNHSNFQSVSFEGSSFENVIFQKSNFEGISFENADLKNCIIDGKINEVNFDGAILDNVYLNGKKIDKRNC